MFFVTSVSALACAAPTAVTIALSNVAGNLSSHAGVAKVGARVGAGVGKVVGKAATALQARRADQQQPARLRQLRAAAAEFKQERVSYSSVAAASNNLQQAPLAHGCDEAEVGHAGAVAQVESE